VNEQPPRSPHPDQVVVLLLGLVVLFVFGLLAYGLVADGTLGVIGWLLVAWTVVGIGGGVFLARKWFRTSTNRDPRLLFSAFVLLGLGLVTAVALFALVVEVINSIGL
jgi:hypothetical protein